MRYRVLYGRVVIECDDPQDAVFIAESIAKRDGFACGNPVDNESTGQPGETLDIAVGVTNERTG